jgi:hypothetical protein
MKALSIHAGPRALRALRAHGLRPQDVRLIPAAAGGPKGLVLNPLDRFIFGDWLAGSTHPVHLLGASIGAWRMATACMNGPAAAFAQMADDYIHQNYDHRPGRLPPAAHVSQVFGDKLQQRFGGREHQVLQHPRFRLHLFTSRGRHLLRREGALRTPLGYLGAFAANVMSRSALGGWIERVVFSDPREPLPLALHGYRTQRVALSPANLQPAMLASCSVPFALKAVNDIPGGPLGAYWDGGITDYHLHLNYAEMPPTPVDEPNGARQAGAGLVLYPHFQQTVIPGWLDKGLRQRHRATAQLDNVVLLSPSAEWVASLPNAKLPDRDDFKRYNDDPKTRIKLWLQVVRESERLKDEFAEWLKHGDDRAVQPLR